MSFFNVMCSFLGGGGGGGGLGNGGSYGGGSGNLAVITRQRVQYVDVPSQGFLQPTNLNVGSSAGPINFNIQSSSSPVNIQHRHQSTPGSFRQTQSVDEAHRHTHTVNKPSKMHFYKLITHSNLLLIITVIQEVNEIVSPRRIIRQQVQPVIEDINTQVARQVQQVQQVQAAPVQQSAPLVFSNAGAAISGSGPSLGGGNGGIGRLSFAGNGGGNGGDQRRLSLGGGGGNGFGGNGGGNGGGGLRISCSGPGCGGLMGGSGSGLSLGGGSDDGDLVGLDGGSGGAY